MTQNSKKRETTSWVFSTTQPAELKCQVYLTQHVLFCPYLVSTGLPIGLFLIFRGRRL